MAAKKKRSAPVESDAPPLEITTEQILTDPDYFGLVTASPVQRALCRVADGLPLGPLATDPAVLAALGDVSSLPRRRPLEYYVVSGSRVGKTLIAAALALRMALTVDVRGLGPGDEPRIPILSLDKDKAAACYLHLTKNMQARPLLRGLIDHEGRNELDSPAVWIKHPSGKLIQVCVAAGKAAGNAVVSYFLAGVIFDEACKMQGADSAVVNFGDSRKSALGRLLPGAQLVAIGSPWAPFGPMYEAVQTHWRKPTASLVVLRARGREMNPSWWTPERIASLPADVLRTEEEAEFADPESSLLSQVEVDAATRAAPLERPFEPGLEYGAAIDPATRGNAWSLALTTRRRGEDGRVRSVVVLTRQWVGSKLVPLSPDAVFADMAPLLHGYGVDSVRSDQWSADALRDIADRHGLSLAIFPAFEREKLERYDALATRLADGEVELPPDPRVRADLLAVKKKVTASGHTIHLPRTGDGRHCDHASSISLALTIPLRDPPHVSRESEGEQFEREQLARRLARRAERRDEAAEFTYAADDDG